jgi:hypothetical protein
MKELKAISFIQQEYRAYCEIRGGAVDIRIMHKLRYEMQLKTTISHQSIYKKRAI